MHAALNVLLQSAGAVIMKQATVLMDAEFTKRGWTPKEVQQVGHIHDEVQIQAREDLADEVGRIAVKCIEDTTDILGLDCPMTGEYKVGSNWADTH
jgi:DNA polymerase I-like protein with 3'-5' exonuclease and polymerase domains